MTLRVPALSLRWRLFLASSISVTLLFVGVGWLLQRYALRVATASLNREIQTSAQAYEGVWQARTDVLAATGALMASMSDVRAAFLTRDPKTIRDSADELWARVSKSSAVFLVLSPEGNPIASLGQQSVPELAAAIPLRELAARFPKQLAGYVRVRWQLFYVVLTPVYVQTSSDPLLLNVLCAGFRVDDAVLRQLRSLAPGSEFAILDREQVFASSFAGLGKRRDRHWPGYMVFERTLDDLEGRPLAELEILRPYGRVEESLGQLRRLLGLAWLSTVVLAVLISSYLTRRLLTPIKELDYAASEVAGRNYAIRVPVRGSNELSRFAETFNTMCESIQSAQAELRNQEQISTIGRLGTSLVHDLRNPLAAVYGGSEMLVDGQLPPEQARRIAHTIYRASRRIQELLQDLSNLTYSVKPHLEPCRLRELIEAAQEAVASSFPEAAVTLEVAEGTEVLADRSRVERVFVNLLSNAQESAERQASVRVYEKTTGEWVEVFVQDSGAGIPASIRPRLFEPFVTGKRSGMGLGLALSRRSMRDMGGDLALVDSPGGGACFRVRMRRNVSG